MALRRLNSERDVKAREGVSDLLIITAETKKDVKVINRGMPYKNVATIDHRT